MRSTLGLPVRHGPPVVTLTIIAINVAVYIVASIAWGPDWAFRLALYHGDASTHPWRIITSAFAHFGLLHIGFNMIALFQFGRVVEMVLGRARFVILYGLSLLGGSAAVLALAPANSASAGASGAIFGVLAAYVTIGLILHLHVQDTLAMGGLWLAAGFFIPGLSWEAHLGGAAVGAVTALIVVRLAQARRVRSASRR